MKSNNFNKHDPVSERAVHTAFLLQPLPQNRAGLQEGSVWNLNTA